MTENLKDDECYYYDEEEGRYRVGRIVGRNSIITKEMKILCVPLKAEDYGGKGAGK